MFFFFVCLVAAVAAAAPSRRTNGFILFERSLNFCSQCCGAVVERSSFAALDPYSRFGTPQTTLRGALALLFDRAAALFGTKAAAAERHRATIRRCIFEIARLAAILPSGVTLLAFWRESTRSPRSKRDYSLWRETSLRAPPAVLHCVVLNTTPPAAVACQNARPRPGRTVKTTTLPARRRREL